MRLSNQPYSKQTPSPLGHMGERMALLVRQKVSVSYFLTYPLYNCTVVPLTPFTYMTTLAQLIEQRAALEAQIAAARKAEIADAVAQARALVAQYDLTAADVFGGAKRASKAAGVVKNPVAAKYRDPATGATWTGRGKAPKWIDGKDRAQFAI